MKQSSSLLCKRKNRVVLTKEDNIPKVYNNHIDKNVKTKGDLIPPSYKQFFCTMLSSQDKWDLVFEKIIAKLDELDHKPTIEVKESSKK